MNIKLEKLNEEKYTFTNEFGNTSIVSSEFAKKLENIIKNQEEINKIEQEITKCKNDIIDIDSKTVAIKITDFISLVFEVIFLLFSLNLPGTFLAFWLLTIINIILKMGRNLEYGTKKTSDLKKWELNNKILNFELLLSFYKRLVVDLRNKLQDEILLNKENTNEYQDSNNLIYDNSQAVIEEEKVLKMTRS